MAQIDQLTERFSSALRLGGGDISAACQACVQILPVQDAAILIGERHLGLWPWSVTSADAARIEGLQAVAGAGPAVYAFATGVPVPLPDLTTPCPRWPEFAAAMTRESIRGAMVAVPLRLGMARLGTLDLFDPDPGMAAPETIAAAGRIAELLTAQLVSAQAERASGWLTPPRGSVLIHQAAGMVIAHLHVDAGEAYTRLRGLAARHNLSLSEVAERIIERRLPIAAALDTESPNTYGS
ncbi:GAF and ANTAR domain-containing protein [Nocardia sp. NPDC048505]|uniref:GAF and ANTAR domain-containing protein n=1 Tax=unclassified Nocardia TaxID=2637762 RepID=UPI0033F035CB